MQLQAEMIASKQKYSEAEAEKAELLAAKQSLEENLRVLTESQGQTQEKLWSLESQLENAKAEISSAARNVDLDSEAVQSYVADKLVAALHHAGEWEANTSIYNEFTINQSRNEVTVVSMN